MGVYKHEYFLPRHSSSRRRFSAFVLYCRRRSPDPHSQTAGCGENQRPYNLWRAAGSPVSLPHSLHRRAADSIFRPGLPSSLSLDPQPASSRERRRTSPAFIPLRCRLQTQVENPPVSSASSWAILRADSAMGWNTWYSDYGNPTAVKVRQAADAMISSGMADFGYQYVNVDDGWPMKPGSKIPN